MQRSTTGVALGAVLMLLPPWSVVYANKTIEDHRPADPLGSVEVVNVSGSIDISGWDKPEVDVSGDIGDGVERVDLRAEGTRTTIRVVARSTPAWGRDGEAHLIIHVPAKSAIVATLVSSDLKLNALSGDVKAQTVSGNVSGNLEGDVRANTVSGDVRLTARAAKTTDIKTISGDITLSGGAGEVEIATVSGAAKVNLATLTRGRFKTVSGDFHVELALGTNARIDGESVSGSVQFEFPSAPSADFDVQTVSGGIANCFGPKPTESHYGSGLRLAFKNGDDGAQVRVATQSGDVTLCTKGGHTAAAHWNSVGRSGCSA